MMNLKVGDKFHIFQAGRNGAKEYKCHVCAIVDNDMIVYKWFGKHKQYWHYEVHSSFHVKMLIDSHKRWKEGKNKIHHENE